MISKKGLQLKIVKSLNEMRSYTFRAQKQYSIKIKNLEELKKSLLQKAFAGEMTQLSELGLLGLEDDRMRL